MEGKFLCIGCSSGCPDLCDLSYAHPVACPENAFECSVLLERLSEKLCVYRVVETADLALLALRHIYDLHEELAMIPEEVEHGEEFLCPYEFCLIFLRERPMYAYLVEIIEEPSRIHEASSIMRIALVILIILIRYHPPGKDF